MAEKGSVLNADTYIPISNFEHGSTYTQLFMVSGVEFNSRMKTESGIGFARVRLKDVSGEIEGVVWGYESNLSEGDFVVMTIAVKTYRSALEFTTKSEDIDSPVGAPTNLHDYMQGVSDNELRIFMEEVEHELTSLPDETYRNVMCYAMHNLEILSALRNSPYGLEGPMAYKGGLLVHTVHAMRFAQVANQQAAELEMPFSPSLVIAGCVLRNIGWHTTTIFTDNALRARDAFHTIGIRRASARYIDHLMLSCETDTQMQIDESRRQALENMCNAYQEIVTLEGEIVSRADNMADVLEFGAAKLQRKREGNWTDGKFIGHLG